MSSNVGFAANFPSNNSGIVISSIKNFTLCAAQSLDCPQSIHLQYLQCTLWIFVVGTHFNLQITSTLYREICHCHDCHGLAQNPRSCRAGKKCQRWRALQLFQNERPRFSKENDRHYSSLFYMNHGLLMFVVHIYLFFT